LYFFQLLINTGDISLFTRPGEVTKFKDFEEVDCYLPMEVDVTNVEDCSFADVQKPTVSTTRSGDNSYNSCSDGWNVFTAENSEDSSSISQARTVNLEKYIDSIGISMDDVASFLYPAAMSFLLRIVRVLSAATCERNDKSRFDEDVLNHRKQASFPVSYRGICIAGHVDAKCIIAVNLSAKICGFHFMHFNVKSSQPIRFEGTTRFC